MTQPIFSIQGLTKKYGETTVVNNLSFDIKPGECLGVIGPNGAGKTTTIRMCLGLTAPDAGSVSFYQLGQSTLQMPRDALAIKDKLGISANLTAWTRTFLVRKTCWFLAVTLA